MIRVEEQMNDKIARARENARAKALVHIIPDYAACFPDQFEHAVEEIAAHEIRAMSVAPEG